MLACRFLVSMSLLLASAAVPADAQQTPESLAALACSDAALFEYAIGTQEAIEIISKAAVDKCLTKWRDAGIASAPGDAGEYYLGVFIESIEIGYIKRARPLVLDWRIRAAKAGVK